MTPKAFIRHRIGNQRVRLKIPTQKGDHAWFSHLGEQLKQFSDSLVYKLNPATGSLVLEGEFMDLAALGEYAAEKRLFQLEDTLLPARPFSMQVVDTMEKASKTLHKFTGGDLDLPGLLFFGLLGFGLVEIARGNFRSPPWYTAFWYAFGIYTKAILDRSKADKNPSV